MMRIAYMIGRYRHYLADGDYDLPAMAREIEDEQYWASIVASCGIIPICPLSNSVGIEKAMSHELWIAGDCEILKIMQPDYHIAVLRPDWDIPPESEGARKEYEVAIDRKLLIARAKHGKDALVKYLTGLEMTAEDIADLALVEERLNEPAEPIKFVAKELDCE